MGSVYFYFCPSRAVLVPAGAGKGELLGETGPGGVGVGRRTTESFLALANLATPHPDAVTVCFVRAPLWGHPRWGRTLPIPTWRASLRRPPDPGRGACSVGPLEPPAEGWREAGQAWVQFRDWTCSEPKSCESSGTWGGGTGARLRCSDLASGMVVAGVIPRVTLMSAWNYKETPLSGYSFTLCPSQKCYIWGCPGLRGGSITLHLKQVWGYWSALAPGG